ncbi:MAG: NifU family protein [Lentisphaeria bacterium]|nr:NifU family protein [Lentisphaeria bacterium]
MSFLSISHFNCSAQCAACPNASLTLKKLVEGKLQELVCADLQVEEVK